MLPTQVSSFPVANADASAKPSQDLSASRSTRPDVRETRETDDRRDRTESKDKARTADGETRFDDFLVGDTAAPELETADSKAAPLDPLAATAPAGMDSDPQLAGGTPLATNAVAAADSALNAAAPTSTGPGNTTAAPVSAANAAGIAPTDASGAPAAPVSNTQGETPAPATGDAPVTEPDLPVDAKANAKALENASPNGKAVGHGASASAEPAIPAGKGSGTRAATPAVPATPATPAASGTSDTPATRATPATSAAAANTNAAAEPATTATPVAPATPPLSARSETSTKPVVQQAHAADPLAPLRGAGLLDAATNQQPGTAAIAAGTANGAKPAVGKSAPGAGKTTSSANATANGNTVPATPAPVLPGTSAATAAPPSTPDASQIAQHHQQTAALSPLPLTGDAAQPSVQQSDMASNFRSEFDLNMQRTDARAAVDKAAQATPRFTPQSASQLAAQITRRFNNGARVFDIRLDPAELGRVDVRLELSPDQRVQAILTAERPETLAELQRSAKDLARALSEAGLDLADDGLEFQLSEGGDQGDFGEYSGSDTLDVFTETDELLLSPDEPLVPVRSSYGFLLTGRDRVDVMV